MSSQSAAPRPSAGNPNLGPEKPGGTQATVYPAMLTATLPTNAPTLPALRRRTLSLRERLLGYEIAPDIQERIMALDTQRAIYPDGRGALTTIKEGVCPACEETGPAGATCHTKACDGTYKGVPLRMGDMTAQWLDAELGRRDFWMMGVSPYSGGLQGGAPAKPGETSAHQEDTGGWAQHKGAYNPSKEAEKRLTGAEGRFNRMSVRTPR